MTPDPTPRGCTPSGSLSSGSAPSGSELSGSALSGAAQDVPGPGGPFPARAGVTPAGPAPSAGLRPADPAGDGPLDTVDALVQLSFAIQRILAATGAAHDLSVIQIRLLGILRDRQAGMLELARYLGLDKSSMTGLVSRAEKRGLIRRSPSPHDGRAVLVSLTPLGRRLTDEGAAEIGRRVTALTGHLAPDQREHLTRLAAALVRAEHAAARG